MDNRLPTRKIDWSYNKCPPIKLNSLTEKIEASDVGYQRQDVNHLHAISIFACLIFIQLITI